MILVLNSKYCNYVKSVALMLLNSIIQSVLDVKVRCPIKSEVTNQVREPQK